MERAFIYGDSLLKATMPDADMRYHFHLPEVMAQYPSDRLEVLNRAKMGATVPEFTEKLRRAVTALKSAGVQPVLMTLPPIDGQRYFRFISQKTDGGSVLRWLGDVGRIYRHQELYSDAVAALAFAEGVPLIDVRRQFLPQRDLSGLIDTLADWVRARL